MEAILKVILKEEEQKGTEILPFKVLELEDKANCQISIDVDYICFTGKSQAIFDSPLVKSFVGHAVCCFYSHAVRQNVWHRGKGLVIGKCGNFELGILLNEPEDDLDDDCIDEAGNSDKYQFVNSTLKISSKAKNIPFRDFRDQYLTNFENFASFALQYGQKMGFKSIIRR